MYLQARCLCFNDTAATEIYPLSLHDALPIFGDSVTTDHICPAGRIPVDSPAGEFLRARGEADLNTYASRRGNHEVMLRGAFGNQRLRNRLVPHRRGGWALGPPHGGEKTVVAGGGEERAAGAPPVVAAGSG